MNTNQGRCETPMETVIHKSKEETLSLITQFVTGTGLQNRSFFQSPNEFLTYPVQVDKNYINPELFGQTLLLCECSGCKEITTMEWFRLSDFEEVINSNENEPLVNGNKMWRHFWPGFRSFLNSEGNAQSGVWYKNQTSSERSVAFDSPTD